MLILIFFILILSSNQTKMHTKAVNFLVKEGHERKKQKRPSLQCCYLVLHAHDTGINTKRFLQNCQHVLCLWKNTTHLQTDSRRNIAYTVNHRQINV